MGRTRDRTGTSIKTAYLKPDSLPAPLSLGVSKGVSRYRWNSNTVLPLVGEKDSLSPWFKVLAGRKLDSEFKQEEKQGFEDKSRRVFQQKTLPSPKVSSAMADNENNTVQECDNGKECVRDQKCPEDEKYTNNEECSDDEKHSGDEENEEEENDGGERRSGRKKRNIIDVPRRSGYRRDQTGKLRKVIDNNDGILQ
ncbi:hypothetical protein K0M31_008287 [Melipona bicolor]|uniref:Uncharacterized protein n=1 Tax=Melipona bicolor TaxID=60889 RepID=A0AA40FR21_9HYME|nr:hypothetical protein K0M31_008287 [Melipona bicolor]